MKNFNKQLSTYCFGVLQSKAYRILNTKTSALLKEFELSNSQWALLGLIYDEQDSGIRHSAVAEALGVEAPFITVIVDQLQKKNLLLKEEASGQDRRVKVLLISEKGIKTVEEVEPFLRKEMKKFLKNLSIFDVLSYYRVLKIIVRAGNP